MPVHTVQCYFAILIHCDTHQFVSTKVIVHVRKYMHVVNTLSHIIIHTSV